MIGGMTGQIVPFRRFAPPVPPSLAELAERVRRLATDSEDAMGMLHPHLKERMTQRSIGMREILETVRKGEGIKGPTKDQYGDWRIKMRRLVAGRRVHVVVAVREKEFTVITVM